MACEWSEERGGEESGDALDFVSHSHLSSPPFPGESNHLGWGCLYTLISSSSQLFNRRDEVEKENSLSSATEFTFGTHAKGPSIASNPQPDLTDLYSCS